VSHPSFHPSTRTLSSPFSLAKRMYRFIRSVRAPWTYAAASSAPSNDSSARYSQFACPAIIVHQMPTYLRGSIQSVSGSPPAVGSADSSSESASSGTSCDSISSPGRSTTWIVRHGVAAGRSSEARDPSGSGVSSVANAVPPPSLRGASVAAA